MPDKTKKVIMNPSDKEKERINRVMALSKQWGVPTENIFSTVSYGPKNIFTNEAPLLSRQYYTFDSDGTVNNSITDRFENSPLAYPKGQSKVPNPTTPHNVTNPTEVKPTMPNGGIVPWNPNTNTSQYPDPSLQSIYSHNPYYIDQSLTSPIPTEINTNRELISNPPDSAGRNSAGLNRGKTMSLGMGPAIVGINALINQGYNLSQKTVESARQQRRFTDIPSYNPNMYGNGSDILYKNGGSIPGSINQISSNSFSNPILEFKGPSHQDGGIPIAYNNTPVEVEGQETAFISDSGDMHVFGNLYVPGTKKKFKAITKDIANEERRATRDTLRANKIIDEVDDPDNPFQAVKYNSGLVQLQAALKKQADLTSKKEQLATLQDNMLHYANSNGIHPRDLFGKAFFGAKIAPDGITLPARKGIDPWALPETGNIGNEKNIAGYDLEKIPIKRPKDITLPPSAYQLQNTRVNNTIAPVQKEYSFYQNQTPTYNDPLSFTQIAPELFTIGANKTAFVPTQKFNPELFSPYQVSFNDRLQQNNASFRSIIKSNPGNPAALKNLMADKYQADNNVLADEFRTNQGIQNQVTNNNVGVLNQAQLQNLSFEDKALTAKEQNIAATRATNLEALKSLSSKFLQQKASNEQRTLLNQMIPNFRFNTESGKWDFAGGQAPINIGGLPIYNSSGTSNQLNDEEQVLYQRDAKGRLIARTKSKSPGIKKMLFGR